MQLLERVQRRAVKMIQGLQRAMKMIQGLQSAMKTIQRLQSLPYEDRLRGLGLFGLQERRLLADLIAAFQGLKGATGDLEKGLCTKAWSERMKGNGFGNCI